MPATSSAPGSKPQSAPKPKKVKRVRPTSSPPTSAATRAAAAANAQAVAKAEDAAAHAVKVVKRAKRQEKALKQMKVIAQRAEHESRFAKAAAKEARAASKRSPEYKAAVRRAKETTGGSTTLGLTGKPSKHVAAATDTTMQALGEIGTTALPIPAFSTAQKFLRGAKVLRTATRAEDARVAASAARAVREAKIAKSTKAAEGVTAKAKATGKGLGERAKGRLSKVERRARRTRRVDRAVASVANPAIAAGAVSPGDIGDAVRADIKGITSANVPKSVATTAKALPGLINYGLSVGDAAVQAATGHGTGALEATGKQGIEALKALEVYGSGDAKAVEKATENTLGYAFAPLLPRGTVSGPAKALGRNLVVRPVKAAGKGTKAAARRVHVPDPNKPLKSRPGAGNKVAQVVTHTPSRKRIKTAAGRFFARGQREGDAAVHEIEKHSRKSKGTRGLAKNRHGPEAGSAAAVLADYGIKRGDHVPEVLRTQVLPTLAKAKDGERRVNVQNTIKWLEEHPEVLHDDNLWKAKAAIKSRADEVTTSPRDVYLAQARAVEHGGPRILRPHERITPKAEKLTGVKPRADAWAVYNQLVKDAKAAKSAGSKAQAKALLAQARALHKELDPYTRPEHSLHPPERPQWKTKNGKPVLSRVKRRPWDQQMNRAFIDEVKARRDPNHFDEPAWVSDRGPNKEQTLAGGMTMGSHGKVIHVNEEKNARADTVDRSVPAFYRDSVVAPRMQRAVNDFIRWFEAKTSKAKTLDGKSGRVFTSRQIDRLIDQGKFNPQKEVALPTREWRASLEAAHHEINGAEGVRDLHSQINDAILRDYNDIKGERGAKYTIHDREDAIEFRDQLNPTGGGYEQAMSVVNTAGTRLVLGTNPAWLESQVIATAAQALVSQGPLSIARAAKDIADMPPRQREQLLIQAGDVTASYKQPHSTRISMDHAELVDGARGARRTPLGRILYDAVHLQALGKVDRSQTAVWRALVLVAHMNKEVNPSMLGKLKQAAKGEVGTVVRGIGGMMAESERISAKLAGLSRTQRLKYVHDHPDLFNKHLDYLDDVMGNWDAFSRFEKEWGSTFGFYPYIRMGFRWALWGYPKQHPVKAQILYLLAQQERDDLHKLLGHDPSFLELQLPVNYNTKAADKHSVEVGPGVYATGVQPGGRRYGGIFANSIVEMIGEGNLNGLSRTLNPGAAVLFNTAMGRTPFGEDVPGLKEAPLDQQIIGRGLLLTQQLLSLAAPARVAGADTIDSVGISSHFPFLQLNQGEQSVASKKSAKNDPLRDIRSLLAPTIGMSAGQARKQSKVTRAYDKSAIGVKSEAGQWLAMIDRYGRTEATKRLKKSLRGKEYLKKLYAGADTPAEKRRVEKDLAIYYGLIHPDEPDRGPLSSSPSSGGGGPLASSSTSKGPLE